MSVTVKLKLTGDAQSIFNMKNVSKGLKRYHKDALFSSGVRIMRAAKVILRSKVDPTYSTGKLEESINYAFNPKIPEMRVGPDMRVAPYAEWVEFGHFFVSWFTGQRVGWFPGHHYMEGAFLTEKDNIINSIRTTLDEELRHFRTQRTPRGLRIRHGLDKYKGTGQFISGFGGLQGGW